MEKKPKPDEFFHRNFFNEYKVNLDLYNMVLAKRSPTYNHENRVLNIEVLEYVDNTKGKDFLRDNHWNLFINYQLDNEVIVAECYTPLYEKWIKTFKNPKRNQRKRRET